MWGCVRINQEEEKEEKEWRVVCGVVSESINQEEEAEECTDLCQNQPGGGGGMTDCVRICVMLKQEEE